MRQILQNLNTGETVLEDVPCPRVRAGHLLIRTVASLVFAGTERTLVKFGKANLFDKGRQQPEKARMVLNRVKTDGVLPMIEAVRNKLEQPLPMGYCNAGVVTEVGAGVARFSVGDRVASNGKHAEMVAASKNFFRIPTGVSDEAATFTVSFTSALGDSITITLSARSDPFEGIRDSIDFQWSELQRILMIFVRWSAGEVHIDAMSGIGP